MEYLVARNPRVKSLKRLMSSARERRETGLFVLEHVAAIGEAITGGHPVDTLWVDEAQSAPHQGLIALAQANQVAVVGVAEGVFASVSDTVNAAGVLATVVRPTPTLAAQQSALEFELVLVEVSDPGNAGAIVRAAVGMGASRVVVTAGSVDVFGPKAVRSAAGAVLRVPVVTDVALTDVLAHYRSVGVTTVATVAHGGVVPDELADEVVRGPLALLIGSEAHGLDPSVVDEVDHRVTIPLMGGLESLNAAVATAVVGFDVARRRRAVSPPS